jgi:hypothetical protein
MQYYHRCYLMQPTTHHYIRASLVYEYYGTCEHDVPMALKMAASTAQCNQEIEVLGSIN